MGRGGGGTGCGGRGQGEGVGRHRLWRKRARGGGEETQAAQKRAKGKCMGACQRTGTAHGGVSACQRVSNGRLRPKKGENMDQQPKRLSKNPSNSKAVCEPPPPPPPTPPPPSHTHAHPLAHHPTRGSLEQGEAADQGVGHGKALGVVQPRQLLEDGPRPRAPLALANPLGRLLGLRARVGGWVGAFFIFIWGGGLAWFLGERSSVKKDSAACRCCVLCAFSCAGARARLRECPSPLTPRPHT